jgi:hypothetical protein
LEETVSLTMEPPSGESLPFQNQLWNPSLQMVPEEIESIVCNEVLQTNLNNYKNFL